MTHKKPDIKPDKGHILAVDAGLRTGLALFEADGRLKWYRSSNFGGLSRLKQGVYPIIKELPEGSVVVIEGGGQVAVIWEHEAARRGLELMRVSAECWRGALLLKRHQRSGPEAKRWAGALARRVIQWSGAPRPTSLRHDAAEAILIGLWAVLEKGWLEMLPEEISRG